MNTSSRVLIALSIVAAFVIGAATAHAVSPATPDSAPPQSSIRSDTCDDPGYRANVKDLTATATKYQRVADSWYHRRMVPSHDVRAHRQLKPTCGLAFAKYRAESWRKLAIQARLEAAQEQRLWDERDRSMWKAIENAAATYHISARWMHDCVSTEGGHNGWVMNTTGSGAGGWAQFMESTFYGNVGAAMRRHKFPAKYIHWTSRVGQAQTMAYMFSIGQQGQWTGSGCHKH